jgi:hypothetical protein
VKVKQTGAVVVEDLDIRHPLFIRLLPYEPELGRIVHLRGYSDSALCLELSKFSDQDC